MKSRNPRKRNDDLQTFKLTHEDIRAIMDDPDVRILGDQNVSEDQMFLIRTIRPNGTAKYMREMMPHHTLAIKFNAITVTVKEDNYDGTDVIPVQEIASGGAIAGGRADRDPVIGGVKLGGDASSLIYSLPAGVVVGGGEPLQTQDLCFAGWAHVVEEPVFTPVGASVLCGGSADLEIVVANAGTVCSGEAVVEYDIHTIVFNKAHMKFRNILSEFPEPPFNIEAEPYKNLIFEKISKDSNLKIVFHFVKRIEKESYGVKYLYDPVIGMDLDPLIEKNYTIVMGIYDKRDRRNIALDIKRIEQFDEIEIANIEKEYFIENGTVPNYVENINGGIYNIVKKVKLNYSFLDNLQSDVNLSGASHVVLVKEGTNVLLSGNSTIQIYKTNVRCGGEVCLSHYINSTGVEQTTCFDILDGEYQSQNYAANTQYHTYYCIDCSKWTGITEPSVVSDLTLPNFIRNEDDSVTIVPQKETGMSELGVCCCNDVTPIYSNSHRRASESGLMDAMGILNLSEGNPDWPGHNEKWINPYNARPKRSSFPNLPKIAGRGLFNDSIYYDDVLFKPARFFSISFDFTRLYPGLNLQEIINKYFDEYEYNYTWIDPYNGTTQNITVRNAFAWDWVVFQRYNIPGANRKFIVIDAIYEKEIKRKLNYSEIIDRINHFGEIIYYKSDAPDSVKKIINQEKGKWINGIYVKSVGSRVSANINRLCITSYPNLQFMTKYNCLQLMGASYDSPLSPDDLNVFKEGRFIPNSERKAFDPNECDKCKDACCYPVYDCSTCIEPKGLPDINYTIFTYLPCTYEYFNTQENKIVSGSSVGDIVSEYVVSSAESDSPILLNKAGWNSEKGYPEKIAGKTIVWWRSVFAKTITCDLKQDSSDLDKGAPLYSGPAIAFWYEKYFCLLCEDGELIDITEDAIHGAKLKTYIVRDQMPPISDGSFGMHYFSTRIYTEFASGGVTAAGRHNTVYYEEMNGGVVVGMYGIGGVIFGSKTKNSAIYQEQMNGGVNLNSSTFNTSLTILNTTGSRYTLPISFKTMDLHDDFINNTFHSIQEVYIGNAADISFTQVTLNYQTEDVLTQQDFNVYRVENIEQAEASIVDRMSRSPELSISGFSFFNSNLNPGSAEIVDGNILEVVGHTDFNFWDYPDFPETYQYGTGKWIDRPTAMNCEDQEPAYYECEDKLVRKIKDAYDPFYEIIEDKKDWCEKTKKGKFHTTRICDEITCPQPEIVSLNNDKKTIINKRRFKRENPLP